MMAASILAKFITELRRRHTLCKMPVWVLAALLALSGCTDNDEKCWFEPGFTIDGEPVIITDASKTTVPASSSSWIDTGLTSIAGSPLGISIDGTVSLCAANDIGFYCTSSTDVGCTSDASTLVGIYKNIVADTCVRNGTYSAKGQLIGIFHDSITQVDLNTILDTDTINIDTLDGSWIQVTLGEIADNCSVAGYTKNPYLVDGVEQVNQIGDPAFKQLYGKDYSSNANGTNQYYQRFGPYLKLRTGSDSLLELDDTYDEANDSPGPVIFTTLATGGEISFYKEPPSGAAASSSGAQAIYLQKIHCASQNGAGINYNGTNIGKVQIAVVDSSELSKSGGDIDAYMEGKSAYFLANGGSYTPSISGKIYLRVYDTDYTDNKASYSVTLDGSFTSTYSVGADNILSWLFTTVKNTIQNTVKSAHTGITQNTMFQEYVIILTTFLIAYLALRYVMGIEQMQLSHFVKHVLKIGLVGVLISPDSLLIFTTYVYDFYFDLLDFLLRAISGDTSDAGTITVPILNTLQALFSKGVWVRIAAVTFTPPWMIPFGIVLMLMFVYVILVYFMAVVRCALAIMMALLVLGLLMTLAPLFLTFALFQETKSMFDNWTRQMFRYALEPAFLVGGVNIIGLMCAGLLYSIFSFPVCWKCVLNINSEILPFCIYSYVPWGLNDKQSQSSNNFYQASENTQYYFGNSTAPGATSLYNLGIDSIILVFYAMLLLWIFSGVLNSFIRASSRIVNALTGTNQITGEGLTKTADSMLGYNPSKLLGFGGDRGGLFGVLRSGGNIASTAISQAWRNRGAPKTPDAGGTGGGHGGGGPGGGGPDGGNGGAPGGNTSSGGGAPTPKGSGGTGGSSYSGGSAGNPQGPEGSSGKGEDLETKDWPETKGNGSDTSNNGSPKGSSSKGTVTRGASSGSLASDDTSPSTTTPTVNLRLNETQTNLQQPPSTLGATTTTKQQEALAEALAKRREQALDEHTPKALEEQTATPKTAIDRRIESNNKLIDELKASPTQDRKATEQIEVLEQQNKALRENKATESSRLSITEQDIKATQNAAETRSQKTPLPSSIAEPQTKEEPQLKPEPLASSVSATQTDKPEIALRQTQGGREASLPEELPASTKGATDSTKQSANEVSSTTVAVTPEPRVNYQQAIQQAESDHEKLAELATTLNKLKGEKAKELANELENSPQRMKLTAEIESLDSKINEVTKQAESTDRKIADLRNKTELDNLAAHMPGTEEVAKVKIEATADTATSGTPQAGKITTASSEGTVGSTEEQAALAPNTAGKQIDGEHTLSIGLKTEAPSVVDVITGNTAGTGNLTEEQRIQQEADKLKEQKAEYTRTQELIEKAQETIYGTGDAGSQASPTYVAESSIRDTNSTPDITPESHTLQPKAPEAGAKVDKTSSELHISTQTTTTPTEPELKPATEAIRSDNLNTSQPDNETERTKLTERHKEECQTIEFQKGYQEQLQGIEHELGSLKATDEELVLKVLSKLEAVVGMYDNALVKVLKQNQVDEDTIEQYKKSLLPSLISETEFGQILKQFSKAVPAEKLGQFSKTTSDSTATYSGRSSRLLTSLLKHIGGE